MDESEEKWSGLNLVPAKEPEQIIAAFRDDEGSGVGFSELFKLTPAIPEPDSILRVDEVTNEGNRGNFRAMSPLKVPQPPSPPEP
jgi:hypothetical protein